MVQTPTRVPGTHGRDNTSVLAAAEKRALIWMARRLPSAVNADHLSALGLAAMVAAGLSFAAYPVTRWAAWGVTLSLVVNWFGDSLDGTLARVRGHQRPRYGFYVDHILDLAGTTALLAGMAFSGLMSPLVTAVLLAAYLLVSAEVYLATHAAGVFKMSFLGCGPTELRLVLVAGALTAAHDPWVSLGGLGSIRLFDLGGAIGTVGLAVVFAVSAVQNGRALYAAEPLPQASRVRSVTGPMRAG